MTNKEEEPIGSLWKVSNAARFLRTTPTAVYKLVERGLIPCIRIGRSIYFHPREMEQWVLQKTNRPSA